MSPQMSGSNISLIMLHAFVGSSMLVWNLVLVFACLMSFFFFVWGWGSWLSRLYLYVWSTMLVWAVGAPHVSMSNSSWRCFRRCHSIESCTTFMSFVYIDTYVYVFNRYALCQYIYDVCKWITYQIKNKKFKWITWHSLNFMVLFAHTQQYPLDIFVFDHSY